MKEPPDINVRAAVQYLVVVALGMLATVVAMIWPT